MKGHFTGTEEPSVSWPQQIQSPGIFWPNISQPYLTSIHSRVDQMDYALLDNSMFNSKSSIKPSPLQKLSRCHAMRQARAEETKNLFPLYCHPCRMSLNAPGQARDHFLGKHHAKRVKRLQSQQSRDQKEARASSQTTDASEEKGCNLVDDISDMKEETSTVVRTVSSLCFRITSKIAA